MQDRKYNLSRSVVREQQTSTNGCILGEKLASFLVRRCRILLVFAVLWGVGSVPLSRQLDLDWKVESMFPAGDPLVDAYRRLEDRFGSNDICLAVYRDPELWSEDGRGLRRLGTVSNRLRQIDGVQSVVSLAELATVMQSLRQPLGALSAMAPEVGTQQDAEAPALLDENDPLAVALLGVFEGYTHRRGNDYVTIACLLKPSEADQAVERGPSNHQVTLGELRRAMADLPSPAADGLVTGEPVLVAEGFRMVERDGRILGLASAGLVALVLLISFRSVRWTLIPLAVVLWALWTTQAVLVLLRLELTMISSTLAALVTVIGVATSMHLLLNFQNGRRQGKSREDALRSALSVLMAPIFWACVTDAIAFIALQYASVGPVQDFGLMMAVASLAVLVAIIVLVPGMALIGKWDPDPSTPKVDLLIRHALRQLLDWISQYRRPGIAAAGLVMAFGAIGCFFLRVETDFTKNFHKSSPIVQGYTVVEKQLGGAGVWDVMLPAPASLSRDYADSVVELSDRLRAIEVDSDGHVARLTKVLSIVDAANAVEEDPWLKLTPFALRLQAMRGAMPEFSRALLSETPEDGSVRWIRIMLRSEESVGAAAKAELIPRVQRELDTFTSSSQWARHCAICLW